MSIRSQARRQARKGKDAQRRDDSLTPDNKKGAKPRQAAPFQKPDCDILEPSRRGLETPSA